MPNKAGCKRGLDSNSKMVFLKSVSKYEIIIFWSQVDQVFVAEVPELSGCMAHGNTQESALTQAKEAIQPWIDTKREFGDPIPEPKGRRSQRAAD